MKPGRSTVYGVLLALGSRPDFWPASSSRVSCVSGLSPRDAGERPRQTPLMLIALSPADGGDRPALRSGELMPDVFAASRGSASICSCGGRRSEARRGGDAGVVHRLWGRGAQLGACPSRWRASCPPHRARAAATPPPPPPPDAASPRRLRRARSDAGHQSRPRRPLAATPGGTGFIFGRLLEDGLVHRYLADACPQRGSRSFAPRDEPARHRGRLPLGRRPTFNEIGGFEGVRSRDASGHRRRAAQLSAGECHAGAQGGRPADGGAPDGRPQCPRNSPTATT